MDETMMHSEFTDAAPHDFQINGQYFVSKRPGLDQFLHEMAKHYELVVFTAGTQEYADEVLDRIDKDGLISHRLYRQHCF